ncbi:MAG TPA: 50S ribosomal protein L25 [Flavobacteriales bacterium]|nr:50S ribosomal protein L25 [Flavobacteriales bacterium]HRP81450.1 50S ribosomal protein L25 [Flavobacteriales bacterium]HRQ84614.1 50S ribosomal protein L25 [Flavobacteriales bacterium]
MKNVELNGTRREAKGSSGAKIVRRNKQVPCVLYGGNGIVHFSVDEPALNKIIHSPLAHRVELDIEGEKHTAIVQDKQFQPVTDAVIHCDFMEVQPGKDISLGLVVRLKGQSAGVRKGGKLNQSIRKLQVRGKAESMPDLIELDVTTLDVGKSIHVGDIKLPGVIVLGKPGDVVASVKMAKKEAEVATATATAAAPAAAPAAPAAAEKAAPAKK